MYEISYPKSAEIKLDQATWILGDRLGGGGFGAVHHGTTPDGADVVLKFVPASAVASRELNLASFPESANVLPVLDMGYYENDLVLVLPLADYSLREHLDSADYRSDSDDGVRILADVASGLDDIESVVHRDLKPENILLHEGRWKLTDFGTSRHADAATATVTQKFVGTWPYFSPEQWRLEHATTATDIYAFGVLAVEVLGGHLPFSGPTPEDFRSQHLTGTPDLAGVPAELRTLIADCLQKPSGARPTASQVLDRLNRIRSSTVADAASPLARANARVNSAKIARQIEETEQAEERERREGLFDVSEHKWNTIQFALIDRVRLLASEAKVENLGTEERKRDPVSTGLKVVLSGAQLALPAPRFVATQADGLPFDVIAHSMLLVDNSHRQGRSHSLWYCDHQTTGTYRWWELSFMSSPLIDRRYSIEPFALDPGAPQASEAFATGIRTVQAARQPTPVDLDDLAAFVKRWADYFGLAANGEL